MRVRPTASHLTLTATFCLALSLTCSGGGGGNGGGAVAPPTITQQPANQATTVGRPATFSAVASGATTYQWQAGTTDIPGATASTYTLQNAALSQNAAAFRVLASNSGGSTASNSAILTVNPLPAFTVQPAGQTLTAPAPATFSATVTGGTPPLAYQWMRNATPIPGATAASYTLATTSASDNGAVFTLVVSDAAGASATSAGATLTVGTAPSAPILSGLSPDHGPPGTVVTLTGTNLSGASSLTFGGAPAAFFSTSPTRILATVPGPSTPGAATFQLTTPGGSTTSSSLTVTADPSISGITGYVFVPSGGGAPVLSPKATPPAGYTPAAGATISFLGVSPTGTGTLSNGGPSASADADGRYLLSGLHPGLGQIRVTPSGGSPLTAQVTVINGATVEIGAPTITRAAALALAQAQVPAGTDPTSLFILCPQSPLPAGVQVSQALGNENGDQDPTTSTLAPASQWFFYIDPDASLKFTHDMLYIFVDAATGAVTSGPATSFPALNGLRFYDHHDVNFLGADLAIAPAPALLAPGTSFLPAQPAPADPAQVCCTPKTWAIILQGADENAAAADVTAIQQMFGNSGLPSPTVSTTTIIPPTGTSPKTQFLAAIAAAKASAQPCDYIFIYVTAHNSVGNAIELEHTQADGSKAPNDEKVVFRDINLQGVKTRNSYLIIDTCYAERTGNAVAQFNAGTGLTVLAAADQNHGAAYSNHYWQGAAPGSSFTSGLVSAFSHLSGYTNFSEALNVAFNSTVISLSNSIWSSERNMNPKLIFAPQGTSHTLSPYCINADHYPGTTTCPQALDAITLTNTGNAALTWSVSTPPKFISLDATSGSIAVGGSATIHPSFNCTNYASGANTGTLVFAVKNTATNAVSNGPTDVAITLTIH